MAVVRGPDRAAVPGPDLDPAGETQDRGPGPAAGGIRGHGPGLVDGTRGPDLAVTVDLQRARDAIATTNRSRDLAPGTAEGLETTIKIERIGPDLGTALAEIAPRIARAGIVLANVPGLAPVPGTKEFSTVLVKVFRPLNYFSPERNRLDTALCEVKLVGLNNILLL